MRSCRIIVTPARNDGLSENAGFPSTVTKNLDHPFFGASFNSASRAGCGVEKSPSSETPLRSNSLYLGEKRSVIRAKLKSAARYCSERAGAVALCLKLLWPKREGEDQLFSNTS